MIKRLLMAGYAVGTVALVTLATIVVSVSVKAADTVPDGAGVYRNNCGSCHGEDGEGFRRVYPAIASSELLDSEAAVRLACVIRNGISGELIVDGKRFNGVMPGNQRISPAEIGAVIGYMQERWGAGKPRHMDVETWLRQCDQE